jgi:menaquinone-dependent protoporphyrinogen oxidase
MAEPSTRTAGTARATFKTGRLAMRAAVFFATKQGQAKRIADRIAEDVRRRGIETDVYNVKDLQSIDWPRYDIAFVAASVHIGHHEREMVEFVKRYRAELERREAAFISITLSQAGAEDVAAPPEQRRQAAGHSQQMIDVFVRETGWRPSRTLAAAGALAYSQYNVLLKFVMKHIARLAGFAGDTKHDYEFTNWPALDRFVDGTATVGSQQSAIRSR